MRQKKACQSVSERKRLGPWEGSHGVRGIKLKKSDEVVSVENVEQGAMCFTVTEKGYGKRQHVLVIGHRQEESSGVINVRWIQNGQVVCLKKVTENEEVILITDTGRTIRFATRDILQNRGGLGVKLMDLQMKRQLPASPLLGKMKDQRKKNRKTIMNKVMA